MTFNVSVDFAHKLGVTNAQIASFYNDYWERPIALSQPNFIDWQFGATPDNHCVVAIVNSEIVGIMAAKPRLFLYYSNSFNGAELSTWVVSPKARRLGIGKKTLKFLQTTLTAFWIHFLFLFFLLRMLLLFLLIYRYPFFQHSIKYDNYYYYDVDNLLSDIGCR